MLAFADHEGLATEVDRLNRRFAPGSRFALAEGSLRVHHWTTQHRTGERYCLRYDFGDAIESLPPRVCFCDPDTLAAGRASDWPPGPESFFKHPPNNGPDGWICTPATREGVEHHGEWRGRVVVPPDRPLAEVVEALLEILNRADVPARPNPRRVG